MIFLAAFFVSAGYVFLKAYQQQNVTHRNFAWILPCSMGMAFLEVSGLLMILKADTIWIFIPIGIGATIGCCAAIYLHERMRSANDRAVSAAKLSTRRAATVWASCPARDDGRAVPANYTE